MELPNRLTYQGSIDPSMVTFHAVNHSGEIAPLRVFSQTALGLKGSASEAFQNKGGKKSKKSNVTHANLAEGNPHEVDYCHVPYGAKQIICEFSCTIEANSISPLYCSDSEVTQKLQTISKLYADKVGYEYLAERYLKNIINGNWLWRNQKTYSTTIVITPWKMEEVTAENVQLKRFEDGWEKNLHGWEQLVPAFALALQNPKYFLILEIKAILTYPTNTKIHPSQVFKESQRGSKSRVYQTTEIENAASPIFGADKTGAAIAMIDDWYTNAEYPIRISSYGVDKRLSTTHRHPETGLDIYSLLMRCEELIKTLETKQRIDNGVLLQLHFVMANLIKGGLFQLGSR